MMVSPIVYRPSKKLLIRSGLFAGKVATMDEISRDAKHIKLVGYGWFPRRMLKVLNTK